MQETTQALHLSADEQVVLGVDDGEVERWLAAAKAGDEQQKEQLCLWAYLTAYRYYQSKVKVEKTLTHHDAEELATEFFLEFEHALPRLQTATRFTRRVLKRSLGRYLKRKRQLRHRETPQALGELEQFRSMSTGEPDRPWERWNDEQWHQYRITLYVLDEADETTRTIMAHRLEHGAYKQIAEAMDLSETAIRMRVARFYKAVRAAYEKFIQDL